MLNKSSVWFWVWLAIVSIAAVVGKVTNAVADEAADKITTLSSAAALPFESIPSAEWATPVDPSRNLYEIAPGLYRSAQPEAADIPRLQALGIRTIINFRAWHRDDDVIDMPGVTLIHIPMKTWEIGDKQIVAALLAIKNAQQNGPVLIHCQHGADRTGVVSAMYRIVEQGWTREAAMAELRDGHYGFHSIWVNIPRYLERVDIANIRRLMTDEYPRQTATALLP